jgi:DNA-binding NarL/FixJ family response regulator
VRISLFTSSPAVRSILASGLSGSATALHEVERHEDLSEADHSSVIACFAGELREGESGAHLQKDLHELGLALIRAANSNADLAPRLNLTRKQLSILKLVADGKSDSQIAAVQGTTARAVRAIIARIFSRTNPGESLSAREQVLQAQRLLTARSH